MSHTNGFKGFVGYSLRELNQTEIYLFCNKKILINSLPLIHNRTNFSSDFMIRAYTSGCYYYDINIGKWLADGMEIYEDTDLSKSHCSSNHLTSFASGLALVPQEINFQHVFADASFTRNPCVYITVIIIICIYILFAIWAKYMDFLDSKKSNTVILIDNNPLDDYAYELIVFTGNRSESGTRSKVNLIINFSKLTN
jgi:hypothetical protein